MGWYVLFVKTGKETIVRDWLKRKLAEHIRSCIVPKRKVPEKRGVVISAVEKVIYPGYVFIDIPINFSTYYEIAKAPNFYNLLNYRNKKDKQPSLSTVMYNKHKWLSPMTAESQESFFREVPEEEMRTIVKLINEEDVIDYSKIYVEGKTIQVVSGPLKGKEGIIKKIDKHKNRAKIMLPLFEHETLIDVGIEVLRSL